MADCYLIIISDSFSFSSLLFHRGETGKIWYARSVRSNYLIYYKQFSSQDILTSRARLSIEFTLFNHCIRQIEMYFASNGYRDMGKCRAAPFVCFSSFVSSLLSFLLSNKRIARKWYKLKMKKNTENQRRKKVKIEKKEKMTGNDRVDIVGAVTTASADACWLVERVTASGCSMLINRFQKSCNNFKICEFRNCY